MHKVNAAGATATSEFTEGNPGTGTPATHVPAAWLNTVQRELVNLAESTGQALDPQNDGQCLEAVHGLIAGTGTGGAGGKNLLVNGDFGLQQRVPVAGSFALTNAAAYTLDRWVGSADLPGSGAGTATVSRQAHTLGQVTVPGATYFLRWQQTAAATAGAPRIAQRVENVQRFGSGKHALSVSIKGSSALACTLRVVQKFGTGGSPSVEVVVATQNISLSTAFVRFSLLVDFATFGLSGKTIGTNGDSHLLVELQLPMGATYTVELSDFQLERSATVTAFDRRAAEDELQLARRFYERSGSLAVALDTTQTDGIPTGHAASGPLIGSLADSSWNFRVAKRRIPTVRWWSDTGVPDSVSLATPSSVWSAVAVLTGTPYRQSEQNTGFPSVASTAGYQYCRANWEADAEL